MKTQTTRCGADEEHGAERRLTDMAALLHQGFSADEAAMRVRVQEGTEESPVPRWTLGDLDALWQAAVGFDIAGLRQALDDGFALGDYGQVVDGWLLPSLRRLGEAWAQGDVSVAEEHFASAAVHRRLSTIFEETPRPLRGPRVLVGLAPGSRHELGVLSFAIALRGQGVDAIYLGGDVPIDAWTNAVTQRRPDAVVIAVPSSEDVPACRELAVAVSQVAPGLPLLAGGSHQHMIDAHVTQLGHQVMPAAEQLAAAVRAKV